MRKLCQTLFTALALFAAAGAYGQVSLGLNYVHNTALKSFKENVNRNPVGFGIAALVPINNSRFSVGGELGIAMYANETYIQELSDQGFEGALSEVYEENCFVSYSVFGRLNLIDHAFITPYLEGRMGAISFFTDKIFDEPYSNDPNAYVPDHVEPETQFHGTSFQLGGGWGLQFDLQKFSKYDFPLSIDFGMNYLLGSSTQYRNVSREPENITTDSEHYYKSTTNNVTYRIGFAYRFY